MWTKCQSVACPLSELNWHMGDCQGDIQHIAKLIYDNPTHDKNPVFECDTSDGQRLKHDGRIIDILKCYSISNIVED